MDAALKYLGYSERTAREVEAYLDGCSFAEADVAAVVERLMELNLVNDARYAAEFIRTRLATKPVSRAHLKEQLLGHGLSSETVGEALSVLTDETERENALATARKYTRQFQALPQMEREARVTKRLLSRGYGYDTVRSVLLTVCEEEETP